MSDMPAMSKATMSQPAQKKKAGKLKRSVKAVVGFGVSVVSGAATFFVVGIWLAIGVTAFEAGWNLIR